MGLLHRTTRSTRRPRARALGASAALIGVLLMSSGAALLVTAGSAGAVTATDCVPSEAYTTYIHHDAVTHVEQVPAVTHTVHHDAVAAVPDKWWNWSPNNSQGPQDYTPAFPDDARGTWQGPHTDGGPQQGTYGTFQTGGGNSPFFHRSQGTAGKDAYDEVVVDKPASEKTVLDQAAYDEPVVHPAVTCDDETPTCEAPSTLVEGVCTPPTEAQCEEGQVLQGETCVTPPTECETTKTLVDGVCTVVDPPSEPTVVSPPTTPTTTTVTPAKTVKAKPVKTTKTATTPVSTTTIPTAVHAGLAGDVVDATGAHTQQGIALLVAGALVLLAGGLGMTRRTGAHVRA